MDNKLSELSKPVAYMTAEGVAITPLDFESGSWGMHNAAKSDDMWRPLYSQEYVSALLAENERVASDLVARNGEIEGLRKRAAELEAKNAQLKKELHNEGAANAHAYERIRELEKRLEESRETTLLVRDAWQKDKELADAAEKRLATPVRLPGSFYPDGDIECPLVIELDEAVEAIRTAGFKVEGDE